MPLITLETDINAPVERVFDLARCMDCHMDSAGRTREIAVAGKTSGLINLGESVTWRGRHLGVMQTLTTEIVAMEPPRYFRDVMRQGAFKAMQHDHIFEVTEAGCRMTDRFYFESPYGTVGRWFDALYLTRYMTRFLQARNAYIKQVAEGESWKRYLP